MPKIDQHAPVVARTDYVLGLDITMDDGRALLMQIFDDFTKLQHDRGGLLIVERTVFLNQLGERPAVRIVAYQIFVAVLLKIKHRLHDGPVLKAFQQPVFLGDVFLACAGAGLNNIELAGCFGAYQKTDFSAVSCRQS